jgi:hypothetical protein
MNAVAWQTPVVFVIAILNTALTLIAANVQQLGVQNPWILLVVLPTSVFAGTLAANQLKSVGQPAPNTTTETKTTTVTPPPAPPQP